MSETHIIELRGGPLDRVSRVMKGARPIPVIQMYEPKPVEMWPNTQMNLLELNILEYGYSHMTPTGVHVYKIKEETE